MSANKSRPKAAKENLHGDSTADAERAEAIAWRRARDVEWFRANPTRNVRLRFATPDDGKGGSPAGVVLLAQRGRLSDGSGATAQPILDRWPTHALPPCTAPDDAAVYAVAAWANVASSAACSAKYGLDPSKTVAQYAEHLMYHLWRWARTAPLWFATPGGHA